MAKNADEEYKYVVKVADFGMSRVTDSANIYKNDHSMLPVKWTAPGK